MQDAFRCDANSDFLRRFRLNIQANWHMDRVSSSSDTCIQQMLTRYGNLSARTHEAYVCQRLAKRLLRMA